MRILLDTHASKIPKSDLVEGQLLTPLTRYSLSSVGNFAIDNGAYSGFRSRAFEALVQRSKPNRDRCLFVSVPDVVGSVRRTKECWDRRFDVCPYLHGWPLAFVAQDGCENLEIPWGQFEAVFIGGTNDFKDSKSALDVVSAAKIMRKHIHVGRVNSVHRFLRFHRSGADTCDGSGLAKFDHMIVNIELALEGSEHRVDPVLSRVWKIRRNGNENAAHQDR